MKIVYYSGAITGSGHIIQGISIYHAMVRSGSTADYSLLGSSHFPFLADEFSIPHIQIPAEDETSLSAAERCRNSTLYRTIRELEPDILIVDLTWFTLSHFIRDLTCKKIILFRQLSPDGFIFPLMDPPLQFDPNDYDLVIATEPFEHTHPMEEINPIVIRNRNEIFLKEEARTKLGVPPETRCCLFALNGKPGEFEEYRKTYSYLEDEGYTMIYSSNYKGGLFPAVDYFNAFDLIITGGGYNSFWETRYFEKEAYYIPFPIGTFLSYASWTSPSLLMEVLSE